MKPTLRSESIGSEHRIVWRLWEGSEKRPLMFDSLNSGLDWVGMHPEKKDRDQKIAEIEQRCNSCAEDFIVSVRYAM